MLSNACWFHDFGSANNACTATLATLCIKCGHGSVKLLGQANYLPAIDTSDQPVVSHSNVCGAVQVSYCKQLQDCRHVVRLQGVFEVNPLCV